MKKIYSTIVMATVVLALGFTACGGSDDEDNMNSSNELNTAYKKLQTSIIGTWVMESYCDIHRSGNPYTSLGWNDPWPYASFGNYKYVFSSDGKVTDNQGKTYTYSVYVDENKTPYYTEKKQSGCWPYSKGVIYLKLESEYSPFYAEIKSDGMLYLYNTIDTTGGDGVPHYRYKRQ